MKAWKKSVVVFGITASMFAGLFACSSDSSSNGGGGGGYSCTAKGSCPNDTAPTQQQIDKCNASLADTNCGAAAKALGECGAANSTCDDKGKSAVTGGKCDTQFAAYFNCLTAHLDAGGGG